MTKQEAILFKEEDLKDGDWVYTPSEIFGSGGKEHNIFQYDSRINYHMKFADHDIKWYKLQTKENESKNSIDFNKLRDEFFAECTHEKYNQDAQWDERFQKIVSLAPHDLFEWFKKKLTTKL